MPKIHILPEQIISKIAAGEVIERPASVMKELVENALDAKADTIEVDLQDSGKKLIRIKDNGEGIEPEDLEKIFSRHATSKINQAEDLFNIETLGFRGEALYSISAVADVTLRSKTADRDCGWEIHIRGGKRLDCRPCQLSGCGTQIEIKELFYNTPARRKFLKTDTTELKQALNLFIPYTLLYPSLRFRLSHEERDLVQLNPSTDYKSRFAAALNLEEKYLLEVSSQFKEQGISIRLVLADINIKRTRRDTQFIFVNDRPVQNKGISFHLNQIYRLLMPEDFSPVFGVYLHIPPGDIDVNIHPTKKEVKIKNESEISSLLRSLAQKTLLEMGQIKTVAGGALTPPENTAHPGDLSFRRSLHPLMDFSAKLPDEIFKETLKAAAVNFPPESTTSTRFLLKDHLFSIPPTDLPATRQDLRSRLKQARAIGVFLNKYLLYEIDQSLLVVDQHAAAERINYERLLRQAAKGEVQVQHLLTPVLIKLIPQELLSLEDLKDDLERFGFTNSLWDQDTLAVHSHPVFIKDIEKAIRHILSGEAAPDKDHDTIARRACRSSVMAGDHLNPAAIVHQRQALIECLDPFTCPHGRPTVIEITDQFLNKQFLRR